MRSSTCPVCCRWACRRARSSSSCRWRWPRSSSSGRRAGAGCNGCCGGRSRYRGAARPGCWALSVLLIPALFLVTYGLRERWGDARRGPGHRPGVGGLARRRVRPGGPFRRVDGRSGARLGRAAGPDGPAVRQLRRGRADGRRGAHRDQRRRVGVPGLHRARRARPRLRRGRVAHGRARDIPGARAPSRAPAPGPGRSRYPPAPAAATAVRRASPPPAGRTWPPDDR